VLFRSLFNSKTDTPESSTPKSLYSASPRSGSFPKRIKVECQPLTTNELSQENSIDSENENCDDSITEQAILAEDEKSDKLKRSSTSRTSPSSHLFRGIPTPNKPLHAASEDAQHIDSFASPDAVVMRGELQPSTISPDMGEGEDVPRHCNCKMSKCLKLYCECFQVLGYCGEHCRCLDCFNIPSMEQVRQEAVQATKDRNNTAFINKVSVKGHSSGCNCKKSQCLKKYCECFEGGVFCGRMCKCKSCSNFSGSESLEAVMKENEKKAFPVKEKAKESAKKRKLPEFEKEERNRQNRRNASKRDLHLESTDCGASEGDESTSRYSSQSRA